MRKIYPLACLLLPLLVMCGDAGAPTSTQTEQVESENPGSLVYGIGKVIPKDDILLLSSEVQGMVERLHKKENDTVQPGMVIVEMKHAIEDEKAIQLAQLLKTQALQVRADKATITELEAKATNATLELERGKKLYAQGAETQQVIEVLNANSIGLTANLKRQYTLVAISESRLLELKSDYALAILEKERRYIKSPISGYVLELNVLPGSIISPEKSVVQLCPFGPSIAICEIDEANADKIKVGQIGWIRTVGANDTLASGTVYFVYSFLKKKSLFTDQSGEKEDRRVRTIKMLLEPKSELLLNSRVECVIAINPIKTGK